MVSRDDERECACAKMNVMRPLQLFEDMRGFTAGCVLY